MCRAEVYEIIKTWRQNLKYLLFCHWTNNNLYIYIYIYISVIPSQCPKTVGVDYLRIYEEYHINLCECSMYGYCYLSFKAPTLSNSRDIDEVFCWRSKDELISDVLLWTPTHGCARVGRPVRTYIQQLCEDTGCNPEDLPEAMNDREKWRETVRDIRAGGATWWWWIQ